MNCQKCGTPNISGERFCKNCGCILENVNQQTTNHQSTDMSGQASMSLPNNTNLNQQSINTVQPNYSNNMNNNVNSQQMMYNNNNGNNGQNINGNLNSNYVQQAVNPNMKKWAILSIIVPIAGMIWYFFIGLSFYIAILIAGAGFGFAQKGEMANKKMAVVGKVLNGMLCAMAIIMLILQLIGAFAQ